VSRGAIGVILEWLLKKTWEPSKWSMVSVELSLGIEAVAVSSAKEMVKAARPTVDAKNK
jgi:hypothetical protein